MLVAAHLLGVALKASSLGPLPAAARERYFVVRLAAQQRLVELCANAADGDADGAGGAASKPADAVVAPGGWHGSCLDVLARSLAAAERRADSNGFVDISAL